MTRKTAAWMLLVAALVAAVGTVVWRTGRDAASGKPMAATPAVTLKPVTFGMLPYGDHTYAIIGAKQNWFRDVGIDLQYRPIKVEEIVPLLKNRSLDVVSTPPGILFAAHDNAPNLISFVFGDLFQGYAILAQPDGKFQSYAERRAAGAPPEVALREVVAQLRGRTFAYPTEAAIKPFIDLVLERGGLQRADIKSMVLDDPLTVNAMRKKEADFQVGGVPSRIVLEREGYKVLLTSIDLARMARPGAESKELGSILQNGWATTKEFYRDRHDDILRIASVNYRIMQATKDDSSAALAIHMPYLSEVSGQQFTPAEGKVIYDSLNPFFTFDQQREWFHNQNSPLYYAHVNGAILNTFLSQGVYKGKPPTVEDVIFADDIYRELEELKATALSTFRQIEGRGEKGLQSPKYVAAKRQYEIFNYLDASRLAKEALDSQ